MKNLISYPKHALSTILVFFVFLMIVEAQDYSQVRRQEGLIMQRLDTNNVGMINYFHREDEDYSFVFMRATKENLGNNCIITDAGALLVNNQDLCHRLNLPPDLPSTVKLYVNGDAAQSTGNSTWSILSDERLKKEVNPLKNSLDVLQKVEFVEFEYNGLATTPKNKKYFGVLAQQVSKVLPSTVNTFSKRLHPSDKKNTELLMFNPNDLIYTGLNAVKELADITEKQHKELLEDLEEEQRKNRLLESRVNDIENKLEQLVVLFSQNEYLEDPSLDEILFNKQSKGRLYPSIPNPLHHSTSIKYELSKVTDEAFIVIKDMHGETLKKIALPNGIKVGTIEFDAKQMGLKSGTYVYTLIVNGQSIDSQKMIFIEK